METGMGYPIKFWYFATFYSFLPGIDKTRTRFRITSFLQGVFDLFVLYVIFQIGLTGTNVSGMLVINNIDVSSFLGWGLIIFGLYITPLMLFSGVMLIFTGLFEREARHAKLEYTGTRSEIAVVIDNWFHSNNKREENEFLKLFSEKDREIMENEHISHWRYKENRSGVGGIVKFYYFK